MSRPPISVKKLSDTLTLCECHPTSDRKGEYWLYDSTRGMNLAMGAVTPEAAFVEALSYYQKRLSEVEDKYQTLTQKVDKFIAEIVPESDDDWF